MSAESFLPAPPTGGSRYRVILAVPGVARLLGSALLARLPIGACSLAILLLVRHRTDSFGLAGITVGAFAITSAIAAPVQGRLLDRFGPRRILAPIAALQAVALVALVLAIGGDAAEPAIVAIAAIAGALVPPISASVRVLWSQIIPTPEGVESAFALDATAQELIWTTGPLIVAASVALATPAVAVLVTVALLVAGTALFVSSPQLDAWPERRARGSRGGAMASRALRLLLLSSALFGLGIGALEVGLPALAVSLGSASMAGVLLTVWSIGSMAGGLAYGVRTWSSELGHRLSALLLASAILILPLIWAGSLPSAIICALVAGLPTAAMLSCLNILVGREAPAGTMAEAFTWSLAALITGIAAGSAIAGQLVDSHGAGRAFLLGAVMTALASLIALASARSVRR